MRHRTISCLTIAVLVSSTLAGESDFAAQRSRHLRTLDDKNATPELRLGAIDWLAKNVRNPKDADVIAILERCLIDGNARIRARAVEARAMLAMKGPVPCPLSVIEAMLDADAEVRERALNWSGAFPPGRYPQAAAPILFRCVKSEHSAVRQTAVSLLAELPKHDDQVVQIVRALTNDGDFLVRNNAYSALFRITAKLDDIIPYCLRFRVDRHDAARIQTGKIPVEEQTAKNLIVLAIGFRMRSLAEERTDELARYLMDMLGKEDASLRRAAAFFLADYFRNPDGDRVGGGNAKIPPDFMVPYLSGLKEPGKGAILPDGTPVAPLPIPEVDQKKLQESAKKLALFRSRLFELGMEKRLRGLRDADPEPLVRGIAAQALLQVEAYQKKQAAKP